MTCIPYSEFEELYKIKNVLGEGAYGKVYDAGDYIVKEQNWTQSTFIKEVSFLAQISHPNICKLEAISFNEDKGYFSMRKGINIRLALRRQSISLKEAITDLVSAISFLSRYGVSHCDIKIENSIFLDGRLQLIDFGLSKISILFDDGYYFTGLSYSPPYMDPEFSSTEMTSIKCETYAISAFIYFINNPLNRNIVYFSSPNPEENSFIQECQEFISNRKTIEDIKLHPYIIQERLVSTDMGSMHYNGVLTNSDKLKFPFMLISNIAVKHRLHSRTVFLAFEICRNAISQSWESSDITYQNLAKMSLYIATSLLEFKFPILEQWIQESEFKDFQETLCRIFRLFEGKFYTLTQWDSLMNSDFSDAINAMMCEGYDPEYAVQLPPSLNENSKNVAWKTNFWNFEYFEAKPEIKLDECLISLIEKGNSYLSRRTLTQEESIIQSAIGLDLKNINPEAFYYLVRNIVVYREYLPNLSPRLKLQILKFLEENTLLSGSEKFLNLMKGYLV